MLYKDYNRKKMEWPHSSAYLHWIVYNKKPWRNCGKSCVKCPEQLKYSEFKAAGTANKETVPLGGCEGWSVHENLQYPDDSRH